MGTYATTVDELPKDEKPAEKTDEKSSPVCAIIGFLAVIALIVGLCVGLWPCDEGFSGRGVGNCEDIDECTDGFGVTKVLLLYKLLSLFFNVFLHVFVLHFRLVQIIL